MNAWAVCLLLYSSALRPEHCLPADIKPTDLVSQALTVEERLAQLGARCDDGRLVDRDNKEIRFYRLTGCWGNPPADAHAILDRQRTELEALSQRYTVIEMTCSPGGDIRQIQ